MPSPEQNSLQKYLKKKENLKGKIITINTFNKMNDNKNSDTYKYLHGLVPSIFRYFDKNFWYSKVEGYKKYIGYAGDRAYALKQKGQAWRANIITPLTRVFADSLYNRIFDSEFSIDVYSTTPSGSKTYNVTIEGEKTEWSPKKSVEALNERAYITSNIDYNIKRAAKDAVTTGDGFWRVDMNVSDEYQNWIDDTRENEGRVSTKRYELKKCNAVAEYIPWEEIVYDGHKDFDESDFVGWRRIESEAKFKERRSRLVDATDETFDYINKQPQLFFDKDYSKFRNLKQYEHLINNNTFGFVETDIYGLDTENLGNKGETYEHRTKETLTVCRNGFVLYDGVNPYGGIIPFVHLGLGVSANQGTNDGICQLLYSTQILYDLVYNGYTDYLKRHYNPMYVSTGGQWLEGFETGYLDWEPYKIIKNLGEGKVERLDLGDDVTNGFSMLQSLYEMASQISGVTRYTGAGAGQGIERSSRAADYQVEITLEVLKPIVSSISRALDTTSKIWCKLATTKLPPKCIVSIMGEKGKEVFKKITLEDLENDFVIKYNNSSIAGYTKSQKLNNLQNFMQYGQTLGQDPARNAYIIDQKAVIEKIAELLEIEGCVLSSEEYNKIREERGMATMNADMAVQNEAQSQQQEQQMGDPNMMQDQQVAAAEAEGMNILNETAPMSEPSFELTPTVVE